MNDRFFPDKAIDVIDEACARARLSVSTVPAEIHELEKKLEEVVKEKEAAIRGQEYEKAARLRDKEKELRARRNEFKKSWTESKRDKEVHVNEDLIATVLSTMTGIPVVKLAEEETQKLLRMEDELRKRVVGQDEAVAAVSRAVRRNRVGLRDPKRPIGSFIFLGPTGRRQDRARARARGVPVRRRGRADPRSTCPSTWRSSRSRGWWERLRAMWGMRRADSSPRRCAASRTRWCCSTRLKKRTRTCSMSCSRCWTTAS